MQDISLEFGLKKSINYGPDSPFSSDAAFHKWHEIFYPVLEYAYFGRPVCLITVEPQPWSLARELSASKAIKIQRKNYLIIFREKCSNTLLRDISESEDFRRGLLWLSSVPPGEENRICNLIQSVISNPLLTPDTEEELLQCENDGMLLRWINYPHKNQEIIDFFHNVTEKFNFGFKVSS